MEWDYSGRKKGRDGQKKKIGKANEKNKMGYRKKEQTRMWVNGQRDGRPAKYRWRPLFNSVVWLTPTTTVPCSNGAKTQNPLKLARVPQTTELISGASGSKFAILWGRVEEILLFNKFFSDCRYMPYLQRYRPTKSCDGAHGEFLWIFFAFCIVSEPHAAHFRPAF